MSELERWFRELRDAGKTEAEALEVIAERLGETVIETKRIVSAIGGVKLRGRTQGRDGKAQAGGGAPQKPLDEPAVQSAYRAHREAGLDSARAVKMVAREFDRRPHDIRCAVGVVEFELKREAGSEQ